MASTANERNNAPRRINIGCGATPTPGWINYDNSLTVRLARWPTLVRGLSTLGVLSREQTTFADRVRERGVRWADCTARLPEEDASVDVVYSSHMLEHLDRPSAEGALSEMRRVLRPGGIIRIAVPNLALLVSEYERTGDADAFVAGTLLATETPRTLPTRLRVAVSGHRHHAWMYDARSLIRLLGSVGFEDAQEQLAGETMIDNPRGLDLFERKDESVYVEARRPRS